jgi:hypothetical protein
MRTRVAALFQFLAQHAQGEHRAAAVTGLLIVPTRSVERSKVIHRPKPFFIVRTCPPAYALSKGKG